MYMQYKQHMLWVKQAGFNVPGLSGELIKWHIKLMKSGLHMAFYNTVPGYCKRCIEQREQINLKRVFYNF